MLCSNRKGRRVRLRQTIEAIAPDFLIVPLRAPGETTRIPLVKCSRSRRVIAAKADCHNADALWIDFGPGGQIVKDRARVVFGIVAQVEATKTDTLAVPRTIHDKTCNAAGDEVR